MFMARAKELCPHLVVVPYEFEKYTAVSERVYRILMRYTACVQPLSCDEAFLDVTGQQGWCSDPGPGPNTESEMRPSSMRNVPAGVFGPA
jgi:nucleotidyltransferase/DNA polymerase involved in DNA repair